MKKVIIGVDESGRGPWLGPVVAVAFALNPDNLPSKKYIQEFNDSKKLTEKKRQELFTGLIEMSLGENPKIFFGVGVVDNFLIDEINIKQANREAMRRAIVEILRKVVIFLSPNPLPSKEGGKNVPPLDKGRLGGVQILIDGNDNYTFEELGKQPEYIVGGDGKIPEIGAASIIAKVFRDDLMQSYAKLYPDLGIESHKGYGTKKHREYLQDGSCVTGIHRVSYKPVKEVLDI